MIGYFTGLGVTPDAAVGPRIAAALNRMDAVQASADVVKGADERPWGCPDPGWNIDPTERVCITLNQYQNVLAETLNNLVALQALPDAYKQMQQLRASTAKYAAQKRIAESAWNKLVTKFEALADWVYRARTTFKGRDKLTKWLHEPRTKITLTEGSLFDKLVLKHFVPKWSSMENQRVTWHPMAALYGAGPKQGEVHISLTPAEREQIENYMRLADIGALMDEINRQSQIANVVWIEGGKQPSSPERKLPSDGSPKSDTASTAALLGLAAAVGIGWWFWKRGGVKSPLTP